MKILDYLVVLIFLIGLYSLTRFIFWACGKIVKWLSYSPLATLLGSSST